MLAKLTGAGRLDLRFFAPLYLPGFGHDDILARLS